VGTMDGRYPSKAGAMDTWHRASAGAGAWPAAAAAAVAKARERVRLYVCILRKYVSACVCMFASWRACVYVVHVDPNEGL